MESDLNDDFLKAEIQRFVANHQLLILGLWAAVQLYNHFKRRGSDTPPEEEAPGV